LKSEDQRVPGEHEAKWLDQGKDSRIGNVTDQRDGSTVALSCCIDCSGKET